MFLGERMYISIVTFKNEVKRQCDFYLLLCNTDSLIYILIIY